MKQAIKIELERAEGLTEECIKVILEIGKYPFTPLDNSKHPGYSHFPVCYTADDLWWTAHAIFAAMGQTAPADGGYDKCDFKITYDDGESYEGRYDMVRGGLDDAGQNLAQHVRHFNQFLSGQYRPAWADDAQWQQVLAHHAKKGHDIAATKFLAEYHIP